MCRLMLRRDRAPDATSFSSLGRSPCGPSARTQAARNLTLPFRRSLVRTRVVCKHFYGSEAHADRHVDMPLNTTPSHGRTIFIISRPTITMVARRRSIHARITLHCDTMIIRPVRILPFLTIKVGCRFDQPTDLSTSRGLPASNS
jgi:hypothetical protein